MFYNDKFCKIGTNQRELNGYWTIYTRYIFLHFFHETPKLGKSQTAKKKKKKKKKKNVDFYFLLFF